MKEKLKDAIYGLAVGDALGVPFEFQNRGEFKCFDMVGYGTHNQPEGTWSDDTSMTLATCMSIKNKGYVDLTDIRNQFEKWLLIMHIHHLTKCLIVVIHVIVQYKINVVKQMNGQMEMGRL